MQGRKEWYASNMQVRFSTITRICISHFLGHCQNLGCFSGAKKSQKSYSRGDRGGSLIDFLQKPNYFLVFLGANYGGFITIFRKRPLGEPMYCISFKKRLHINLQ